MPNETERASILAYIEAHFDDRAPRLIYADWLDEQGEPEEANRQRQWHDAKDWLVAFCRKWNFFECEYQYGYRLSNEPVSGIHNMDDKKTIANLVSAVDSSSDWRSLVSHGTDLHGAGELEHGDEGLFWTNIETLTGKRFPDHDRQEFCWSCTC